MSKVAVIVETREHKALSFVLNNVMSILPDEWGLQIFHGNKNFEYVNSICKDSNLNVVFSNLKVDDLNHDEYVELFTSKNFWESCVGETILIFQTDSMLCPNSEYKVEDFEHFDYIGGWWGKFFDPNSVDESYDRVMNGGLSIRKKSFMLDIIKNELKPYLQRGGNPCEDYFVTDRIRSKPTVKDVLNFSIDNGYMYPLDRKAPFGLHKPWGEVKSKGHGRYYELIKKACPEVKELERLNGL